VYYKYFTDLNPMAYIDFDAVEYHEGNDDGYDEANSGVIPGGLHLAIQCVSSLLNPLVELVGPH
jgi:hypothetical protein